MSTNDLPPDVVAAETVGAPADDSGPAPFLLEPVSPGTQLEENRLLNGPIRSTVFWLSLPILGEQALNAAIAWNDTFLAGRISAVATGAVGFASYVSWLMTMLFAMVGIGATAIVARAIGARNPKEAIHATNQAFVMSVAVGLAGTALVYLIAPVFATMLNMEARAAAVAVTYMRIDSLGLVGAAVSLAMAACLRGAGDTRTPLKVFAGVNIANFILSWVLTFGFGRWSGMGVSGIAWGTVLARYLGALGFLVILQRREMPLQLHAHQFRPDRHLIVRMVRVGAPAALDGLLSFTGHFVFMTIVTRVPTEFPTDVIYAAHIVGIRVESLSYLPANGYMYAAATLVGQNLGAGKQDRARLCANEGVRQTAMIMVASGLVLFFGAEWMFRFLSDSEGVRRCGVPALRVLACFQLTLAPLIVYTGALRGAGDTRVPILITIVGMACVRIPMALFGGFVLNLGLLGAWLGMFSDLTVRAMLVSWRFRRGAWQRIKV